MIPCAGCHFNRAFEHLPGCAQNPFNRSVPAEQEEPPVTFEPECAERIARVWAASTFPSALDDNVIVSMNLGQLRELLANVAREGYVNGVGRGL